MLLSDPYFVDVPAALGVPRVFDVAGVPGAVGVSNVPVVFDADDPAVGDVLTAASSSEVPAVTGVLLLFPYCCWVPW
jgi:hypothetical protein